MKNPPGVSADGSPMYAARVPERCETVVPGLFDLHAHYAIDFFNAGRKDDFLSVFTKAKEEGLVPTTEQIEDRRKIAAEENARIEAKNAESSRIRKIKEAGPELLEALKNICAGIEHRQWIDMPEYKHARAVIARTVGGA